MSDFLNHAITVRDILYLIAGLLVLLWAIVFFGNKIFERMERNFRAKLNAPDWGNLPGDSLRNPVYGVPKDVRRKDGRPYVPTEKPEA